MTTTNTTVHVTERVAAFDPFILIRKFSHEGSRVSFSAIEVLSLGVSGDALDSDVAHIVIALDNACERLMALDDEELGDEDDEIHVERVGHPDAPTGARIVDFRYYDVVVACVREMFSSRTVLEAQ